MFTGIVECLGTVVAMEHLPAAGRLTVSGEVVDGVRPGDSVAVSGVCLTATAIAGSQFSADVMQQTLGCSTLGGLCPGDLVNLELAATPTSRLGGHVVQGHVDGVGTVRARRSSEHWDDLELDLPADLVKYVVAKGSIAVDGVSLTVASVDGTRLRVSLIPQTLASTTLGRHRIGDPVNLEVDILAKHVERLLIGGVVGGGQS